MAKYRDNKRATVSAQLMHRKAGETPQQRHARRFVTAQRTRALADRWAKAVGVTIEVKNNGHHWLFRLIGHPKSGYQVHLGQWWPQTAKLVIWNDWKHGIHAHDIAQVTYELSKELDRLATA